MWYYVWLISLNTVSSVSINAAANDKISFFLIVEYCSTVYLYVVSFLIHSSMVDT